MARRTSRRRTRRNPKYVVANRRRRSRRMRRNRVQRLVKNLLGGADLVKDILVPVAGATGGFIAARYLGNMMAEKDLVSTDPRVTKSIAAGVGIPLTFLAAAGVPMVAKNTGAIVVGMGLAAAESWLRDTKLLGGSPVAAVVVSEPSPPGDYPVQEAGADGLASYYNYPTNRAGEAMSGLASYYNYPTDRAGEAMSGLGDFYTAGMLGSTDPSDQAEVEFALDEMESIDKNGTAAVSTVFPTDQAVRAKRMPQFASVKPPHGDRAYAGGMFARHLFSGMSGQ
jgi:hypothetical protein